MSGWHELNSEGTDCAAGCSACLDVQFEKKHAEAHLSTHRGVVKADCIACRKYFEWLAQRLAKSYEPGTPSERNPKQEPLHRKEKA